MTALRNLLDRLGNAMQAAHGASFFVERAMHLQEKDYDAARTVRENNQQEEEIVRELWKWVDEKQAVK